MSGRTTDSSQGLRLKSNEEFLDRATTKTGQELEQFVGQSVKDGCSRPPMVRGWILDAKVRFVSLAADSGAVWSRGDMERGQHDISRFVNDISDGSLKLPEIQRGYVWKPLQVARLVDSMYRGYPSGSLLLWETSAPVAERAVASAKPQGPSHSKVRYLLDGQQRLTSLHRLFTDHERAQVVFHPGQQKFQNASAATKKDRAWVKVSDLINGKVDLFDLSNTLAEAVELTPKQLHDRLSRVAAIRKYEYFFEIVSDIDYEEVTQIFIRVNSSGRTLKDTDLALATLSCRWPDAVKRFEDAISWCASNGYPLLDTSFWVRAFAAFVSDSASPGGFTTVPVETFNPAWEATVRGVNHAVNLLSGTLHLDNSKLLTSANALVPVAFYLGKRPNQPLLDEEKNALLYWLLSVLVSGRYSRSAASNIAQDVGALRSEQPLERLYDNVGLRDGRVPITPGTVAGKGSTSAYFLLSYLVAKDRGATDWWYNLPLKLSHNGTYAVEFHHIHPRDTLKRTYSKALINDLSNLAFISDRANSKISNRSPQDYTKELQASDLSAHLVPADNSELLQATAYPEFLARRRELLATEMERYLARLCPTWATGQRAPIDVPVNATLDFQQYGSGADGVLEATVTVSGETWVGRIPVESLVNALSDLESGQAAELVVSETEIGIEPGDEVSMPIGPLLVTGSLGEWLNIVEREHRDRMSANELPNIGTQPSFTDLVPFDVIDSE